MKHISQLTYGVLSDCRQRILDTLLYEIPAELHAATYRPCDKREDHYAEPEFSGKYLDLCAALYRSTGSETALDNAKAVVESILREQRADGYLGCLDRGKELFGFSIWNQSFTLLGLLSYYASVKDSRVLDAALRCADYVMSVFLSGEKDILDAPNDGTQHISMLLPLCRLWRACGNERIKDYILHIVNRLKGSELDFFDFEDIMKLRSQKGIENFVVLLGILEYAELFGDADGIKGVQKYWEQVWTTQIRNTGNGTIFERWSLDGNAPRNLTAEDRPNETCVAVGWIELSLALFYIKQDARYLDAIDKTLYNHILASVNETGSDFAYYQPNCGVKVRTTDATSYKCCRYRGFTLFTYMDQMLWFEDRNTLIPMLYTAGRYESEDVALSLETDYPYEPTLRFDILPKKDKTLRLRIPFGCKLVSMSKNREAVDVLPADGYLNVALHAGEAAQLELILENQLILTDGMIDGVAQTAVNWGVLLLAADACGDGAVLQRTPRLHREAPDGIRRVIFKTQSTKSGEEITLCDYSSADHYLVWIPTE